MWNKESHILIRFLLTTFLLIGGLAWGILGLTGLNVISRLAREVNLPILSRIIYTMFGLSALFYLLKYYNRDNFLPFLGRTVLPVSLLNHSSPLDYNSEATLNAPEATTKGGQVTHVVYWAAKGKGEVPEGLSVEEAYGDYSNAGMVEVEDGKALIRFKNPVGYRVGGREMKPHVHYRWVSKGGMLSKVHTLEV